MKLHNHNNIQTVSKNFHFSHVSYHIIKVTLSVILILGQYNWIRPKGHIYNNATSLLWQYSSYYLITIILYQSS